MKQLMYTQDWGTFPGHTIIVCGFTKYEELIDLCKKQKCYEWAAAIESRLPNINDLTKNNHFTRWINEMDGEDKEFSVLWMKEWKEDSEHYSILAHELIHAVSFVLGDSADLIRENELFAYQHTYLFNRIAEQFNKTYGTKKVKNAKKRT